MLSKVNVTKKVGVIASGGGRRVKDTTNLGKVAAKKFDKIIIRQHKNFERKK